MKKREKVVCAYHGDLDYVLEMVRSFAIRNKIGPRKLMSYIETARWADECLNGEYMYHAYEEGIVNPYGKPKE